jgi:hypothetical protein
MGDSLHAAPGADLQLTVHVVGCSGWLLKMSDNGQDNSALPSRIVSQGDAIAHFTWRSDGKRHWLLPQMETPQRKLEVLGNPIYVNDGDRKSIRQ